MEGAWVLIQAAILVLPPVVVVYYLIVGLIYSEIKEKRQKRASA